jgi:glutathione S-transferase
LAKWRALERGSDGKKSLKPLKRELAVWDGYASEASFLAGDRISIVDFAAWPVLHVIVRECGQDALKDSENLRAYYQRIQETDAAVKVAGAGSPSK